MVFYYQKYSSHLTTLAVYHSVNRQDDENLNQNSTLITNPVPFFFLSLKLTILDFLMQLWRLFLYLKKFTTFSGGENTTFEKVVLNKCGKKGGIQP